MDQAILGPYPDETAKTSIQFSWALHWALWARNRRVLKIVRGPCLDVTEVLLWLGITPKSRAMHQRNDSLSSAMSALSTYLSNMTTTAATRKPTMKEPEMAPQMIGSSTRFTVNPTITNIIGPISGTKCKLTKPTKYNWWNECTSNQFDSNHHSSIT